MPPQDSYIEALTPNVIAFGAGAFGRLGLDEGGALIIGLAPL